MIIHQHLSQLLASQLSASFLIGQQPYTFSPCNIKLLLVANFNRGKYRAPQVIPHVYRPFVEGDLFMYNQTCPPIFNSFLLPFGPSCHQLCGCALFVFDLKEKQKRK
jgi:hypothetical protein